MWCVAYPVHNKHSKARDGDSDHGTAGFAGFDFDAASFSGEVTPNLGQWGEAGHAMHQQHRREDLKRRDNHKQTEYGPMIGRRFVEPAAQGESHPARR
jgi:hypothetical protein